MSKISDELREFAYLHFSGSENVGPCDALMGIADRIDAETVELPKDAYGEYIHIEDVMEWCDSGETLTVEGIGSDVLFYIDGENAEWTAARNKRHHHELIVEDVLREFTDEVWNRCCEGATASDSGIDELVAECAAKLRLAVTHARPDSWERIADELEEWSEDNRVNGDSEVFDRASIFADRIRKLADSFERIADELEAKTSSCGHQGYIVVSRDEVIQIADRIRKLAKRED